MSATAEIPRTLDNGRYQIERVLGQGGTACVLLALDTRMGVHRAVKLLFAQYAQATGSRARLKNEARAQAGLKHPNILMVHDVVEDDDGVYLVMELCEGGSLAQRVETEGPLPVREAVEATATIARALEAAHAAGVVHRDIKPGNILIDQVGTLKLADFGIARVLDRDGRLTEAGTIMGTWAFMPPEQRDASRDTDPRADIYALGVTLYYLLTRQSPANLHNRESHAEAFAGMDPDLAAIIARATRMRPEDRYQSCRHLEEDLRHYLDPTWERTEPVPRLKLVGAPVAGEGLTLVPGGPAVSGPGGTPPSQPPSVPAGSVPAASVQAATMVYDGSEPEAPSGRPALVFVVGAVVAMIGLAALAIAVVLLFPRPGPEQPSEPVVTILPAPEAGPPAPEGPGAPPGSVAGPGVGSIAPGTTTAGTTTAGTTTAGTTPAGTTTAGTTTAGTTTTGTTTAGTTASGTKTPGTTSPGTTPRSSSTPRVISVLPTSAPASTATTSLPLAPAPSQAATGTVLLRTIPSGASVSEGGRTLSPAHGGTYELSVGSHLLDVRASTGESTRLPVFVSAGKTVSICHSFDTNSACGGAP